MFTLKLPTTNDMLPLSFFQSKKFIQFLFHKEKYILIGSTPKLGKRFSIPFLLLTIDMYYCEDEPEIVPVKGLHLLGWHVPKDKDVFENIKRAGWLGPFGKYIAVTNPIPYLDAHNPEYFRGWSQRKQTYRKQWLRQLDTKELTINQCDLQEFLKYYISCNLPAFVKRFNQKQMKDVYEVYKDDMEFYFVTDTKINKVIAGVCLMFDFEIGQAIKQYSFVDKNYKQVGVGLVDYSVVKARKNNLKFVNLTLINTKGHNSNGWEGFTKFKLEFNPIITFFRQSYFKIIFNW